jgi:hypothetical protein
VTWSQWFDLTSNEVANEVPTTPGVFCIARKHDAITYPGCASLTVFLGVAEGRQRGLRAVLGEIAGGSRDDLQDERRTSRGLRFCFQANMGDGALKLHRALLDDFAAQHGEVPRCNRERATESS